MATQQQQFYDRSIQIGRIIQKNDPNLYLGLLDTYKLDLVIARDYKKTKREYLTSLYYQDKREYTQAVIKNDVTVLLANANRSAGGKNGGNREKLTRGYTNTGLISVATKRKISNLGELWQNSIMAATMKYHVYKGKRKTRLYPNNIGLRFITLTLPGIQLHSDQVLKRELLNKFLIWLKYQGAKNYIWRAETQKTGKLHFHVITDVYLQKDKLNGYWLKLLNNLGYKGGENAANIKGVQGDQLKSYISKYVAKNPSSKNNGKKINCLEYYKGSDNPRVINLNGLEIRAVDGKIWGASRKLTQLFTDKVIDHFKIDLQQYQGYLPDLLQAVKKRVVNKLGELVPNGFLDEFHGVVFNKLDLFNKNNLWGPRIYFAFLVHHFKNYQFIYDT